MTLIDKDRHSRLLPDKFSESLLQKTRSLLVREPSHLLQLVHAFDQQLERAGVVSTASFGAQSLLVGSVSSFGHDPSRSLLAQAAQQGISGVWGVYQQAQGHELAALNLLYANECLPVETLWLHFLNKYLSHQDPNTPTNLSRFRLRLKLGRGSRFSRLLPARPLPPRDAGPLVSILMPLFNATATLDEAIQSLIGQTWQNWELLLIDDASTDHSLSQAQAWAEQDPRIRVVALRQNGGPYVAKNIALHFLRGELLTVHDADDWAFPTRLEDQLAPFLADSSGSLSMSFGQMLRITAQGEVTHFHPVCSFVLDGALRWCHPSPLFRRAYFEEKLGAWDSVRFGADTEILERMLRFEPEKVALLETPVMLQLDRDGSLTRQPDSYIGPQGASKKRLAYRQAWVDWHQRHSRMPRLTYPQSKRPFQVPKGVSSHALGIEELVDVSQSRRL